MFQILLKRKYLFCTWLNNLDFKKLRIKPEQKIEKTKIRKPIRKVNKPKCGPHMVETYWQKIWMTSQTIRPISPFDIRLILINLYFPFSKHTHTRALLYYT